MIWLIAIHSETGYDAMDEDEQRLKDHRSAIKRSQDERDKVVNQLLSTPEGREYIWWILSITNVHTNPFSNNALSTSFACGEMNIGQRVLAHILEVNPAGYVQMMKEKLNANG